MVHISRTIGPLVSTGQGRHAQLGVKGERMAGFALVQGLRHIFQLGREKVPVVQDLLQLGGNAARIMGGR